MDAVAAPHAQPRETRPRRRSVFVVMPVMDGVAVTAVHVVDVIAVRNGHMAAPVAVSVAVVGVFEVCRGHDRPAFRCPGLRFTRTS